MSRVRLALTASICSVACSKDEPREPQPPVMGVVDVCTDLPAADDTLHAFSGVVVATDDGATDCTYSITIEDADGARHTCLVNLAACELRLDRPYDALAACDRAVAIDETNAKAWYRRGQACMALSQFGAARKDLTRAAKLAPASREVRDELQKAVEGQRARAAF